MTQKPPAVASARTLARRAYHRLRHDIVSGHLAAGSKLKLETLVQQYAIGMSPLREAAKTARPALLEPIMALEIVAPEENLGDVLGDLNVRRGQVKDVVQRDGLRVIEASVPLAELFGYATTLRSLTRGRAGYSMEPARFDVVPESLSQELMNR